MNEAYHDRSWIDGHGRFSADAGRLFGRTGARLRVAGGDPLPIVARAMALVLAVSMTTLTLSGVSGY
jgi:hypothetical protein